MMLFFLSYHSEKDNLVAEIVTTFNVKIQQTPVLTNSATDFFGYIFMIKIAVQLVIDR